MNSTNRISDNNTCLVIIDIQERFRSAVSEFDAVAENISILAQGCNVLGIPVIVTEQYPKGLGHTVDVVKKSLPNYEPIEKSCFACTDSEQFNIALSKTNAKNILVCGVETHVCVMQTVMGLMSKNLNVHCVVNAMNSRKQIDHITALEKMNSIGAMPTTVEMCLFELLKVARGDNFKTIQKLIK